MLSLKQQKRLKQLHLNNRKPEAARNRVWKNYTIDARRREIPFQLDPIEFHMLTQSRCHYCGAGFSNTINEYNYGYQYNGIDRKDPAQGYTRDNCVSCCAICNDMKGRLAYDTFIKKVKEIARILLLK